MANYFKLTLDTLAPSGLTLLLNNGAQFTSKNEIVLTIGCSDSDTTGYQMKIWGINGASTENEASWETYTTSKTVQLAGSDGLKTVYIKIRDDVYNETSTVSASITLNTAVPSVTVNQPDVSKISKISPKNVAIFSFTCDVDFVEYVVKVVPSISSLVDAGTQIAMVNGSTNMSGTKEIAAGELVTCSITGADLETASSGDGDKIIKVFVKNSAGTWSV